MSESRDLSGTDTLIVKKTEPHISLFITKLNKIFGEFYRNEWNSNWLTRAPVKK